MIKHTEHEAKSAVLELNIFAAFKMCRGKHPPTGKETKVNFNYKISKTRRRRAISEFFY